MSEQEPTPNSTAAALPAWPAVLVVVAHPDDESFGLGSVIDAFVRRGAAVTVLCLTRGEASTLHGVDGDLATVREQELRSAADALGIVSVHLLDLPDGDVAGVPTAIVAEYVVAYARESQAAGLLVFDSTGITGHPDHRAATAAAVFAAPLLGLDVLAWTIPERVAASLREEFGVEFLGRDAQSIDMTIPVDRARQRRAVTCHPSQAVPGSALWRRLELQGDEESLRWLVRAGSTQSSSS